MVFYLNSATNFVGLSTTGKAPITFALFKLHNIQSIGMVPLFLRLQL